VPRLFANGVTKGHYARRRNFDMNAFRYRVAVLPLVCAASLTLGAAATGCSSDENGGGSGGEDAAAGSGGSSTGGTGGSGGSQTTGGTGGSGGSTGGTGGSGGSTGGTGGSGGSTGGTGGSGGSTGGTGGDAGVDADSGDGCTSLGALVPPTVDVSIQTPAGVTLEQRFHAEGFQVYTCTGTAGADGGATTYAWKLKAPDATLYDDTCAAVGTHYAGPTWESDADGSTVVGSRIAGFTVDASAVPWLLLSATANTGTGIFSSITYIQRVDTTGGLMPTSGCSAATVNTDQSVPYTATYYFYTGPASDAGDAGDAGDSAG
jgi:hypothetical protein